MRLKDVIVAREQKLPVVLDDGSPWLVVDIAYEASGNSITCYTTTPITLRPLAGQNGGQLKGVGESKIKGLWVAPPGEKSPPVEGFGEATS